MTEKALISVGIGIILLGVGVVIGLNVANLILQKPSSAVSYVQIPNSLSGGTKNGFR